jgi:hypothetical protein
MRVVYAIPVRHIDLLHDGALVAVGIESSVVVAPVPAPITVPLVLCIAASPAEAQAGIDHKLRIRVLGPDLTEAAPVMEMPFQLAPGPNTPAGWEVRGILPVGTTFTAVDAGTYSVEIDVGNAPLSVSIIVQEPPPSNWRFGNERGLRL